LCSIRIRRSHASRASLRSRARKDGSTYDQILYRLDGKQTAASFEDMASEAKVQRLARKFGPEKAREAIRADAVATRQRRSQFLATSLPVSGI
jgi:hypothetical protein